jgi:hypothetical protein
VHDVAEKKKRAVKWVALYGEFNFNDPKKIEFLGRSLPIPKTVDPASFKDQKEQPSFGLALCNRTIADGDISADVVFDEWTPESVCELAVSYDPNSTQSVSAGIGGTEYSLYSIREFNVPNTARPGWWVHRSSGERANLKSGVSYHIEAKFRGATVTLIADGVAVCSADVSSPLGRPRQVGLFCRGRQKIRINGFTVDTSKPKAFVVMQFGTEYDDVYNDVDLPGDFRTS